MHTYDAGSYKKALRFNNFIDVYAFAWYLLAFNLICALTLHGRYNHIQNISLLNSLKSHALTVKVKNCKWCPSRHCTIINSTAEFMLFIKLKNTWQFWIKTTRYKITILWCKWESNYLIFTYNINCWHNGSIFSVWKHNIIFTFWVEIFLWQLNFAQPSKKSLFYHNFKP